MHRSRGWLTVRPALLALVVVGGTTTFAATLEDEFLAENDAAMTKMMADMNTKPTGDVDVDFVATMIPHHQGAIDMARAQLRYGTNEQVRRIAQEIIVTQEEEIAAMRLAVGPSFTRPGTEPPKSERPTAPGESTGATARRASTPHPRAVKQ